MRGDGEAQATGLLRVLFVLGPAVSERGGEGLDMWTVVVSVLLSGMVVWAREDIRAFLRRPKLAIETPEFHDAAGTRYYYLKVTNSGKTTARSAVAQITILPQDVETVFDKGLVTRESLMGGGTAGLFDVDTVWQRAGTDIEVDIHPGQSQRIELGAATSLEGSDGPYHIFQMPSDSGWDRLRIQFQAEGFEFLAKVACDNATPVYRYGWVRANDPARPAIQLKGGPTPRFKERGH